MSTPQLSLIEFNFVTMTGDVWVQVVPLLFWFLYASFAGDSALFDTAVRLVRVVLLGLPPVPVADHGHVRAVTGGNATLSKPPSCIVVVKWRLGPSVFKY